MLDKKTCVRADFICAYCYLFSVDIELRNLLKRLTENVLEDFTKAARDTEPPKCGCIAIFQE